MVNAINGQLLIVHIVPINYQHICENNLDQLVLFSQSPTKFSRYLSNNL